MIKKINENIWHKINFENQRNLNNHLNKIYGTLSNNENYYYSSADNSSYSSSNFGVSENEEDLINIFNIKK